MSSMIDFRTAGNLASSGNAYSDLKFHKLVVSYAISEATVVAAVAFFAASIYWTFSIGARADYAILASTSVTVAAAFVAISSLRGHYTQSLDAGAGFLWSGFVVTLKVFGALAGILFLSKVANDYSRATFLIQIMTVAASVLMLRGLFQVKVRGLLARGDIETHRVMIIGDLVHDDDFLSKITAGGARIVAGFGDRTVEAGREAEAIRDIVATCRSSQVEQVVIRASGIDDHFLEKVVDALSETTVTVQILPAAVGIWEAKSAGSLSAMRTAVINNRPLSAIDLSMKRAFDILMSAAALIVLAPVFVLVAIAIRMDSSGPVFFRQTRHGYDNRPISVFKFRSMRVMENGSAFRQAKKNDPRITRVGHFLRKTNIDELPQILNVLLGEMSIVGPRPHPIALNDSFSSEIRLFNRRHNIRPGITGWAQTNGHRGETETLQKMAARVEHDLWYIDNWSFILDIKIIIMTVFSPVAYRNAG